MPIWKFKQCEEEWKKKQSQQHCFYSFSLSLSLVSCVFFTLCASAPIRLVRSKCVRRSTQKRTDTLTEQLIEDVEFTRMSWTWALTVCISKEITSMNFCKKRIQQKLRNEYKQFKSLVRSRSNINCWPISSYSVSNFRFSSASFVPKFKSKALIENFHVGPCSNRHFSKNKRIKLFII